MALTHFREQTVAEAAERGGAPAAGELLLLCTIGALYCVALVENSTVRLSVVTLCTASSLLRAVSGWYTHLTWKKRAESGSLGHTESIPETAVIQSWITTAVS